ncbi:hypothetical protein BJF79_03295 [Actinomadura sp. CNU-125]|uniref:hypothetical protein n=1 Tax=Actinomadura sp. CNU-125 TaxID=1904961 RepID=UPI00096308DB|nr:hypothetical protein [Actinomadura sp. CNU-125]OLT12938.1 hypothetical protein BJF79_03295 [Actinomadura sp. CNU-125]
MRTTTGHSALAAERSAGRAADAAQDAVALIAQGRYVDAAETLDEVIAHAKQACSGLVEASRTPKK